MQLLLEIGSRAGITSAFEHEVLVIHDDVVPVDVLMRRQHLEL
jgi:hypothetical protein